MSDKRRPEQPSIELHIEELVLHGFAPADRYRIAQAVESELTRLFSEHGASTTLQHGGEALRLNGGSFNVSPGSKPETIGTQIAQRTYRTLGGTDAAMLKPT